MKTGRLTSPVSSAGAELITAGCCEGLAVAEFDTLIHTGAPISYGAFKVHGISEKMLNGKPAPEDVWPSFHEFAGQSPLEAHNARVCHAGMGYDLANPWYCTLRLARI